MRTIQEQLVEKGFSKAAEKRELPWKIQMRPSEKLSDWEWAEIMGSNRDTFKRVKGGAIRKR